MTLREGKQSTDVQRATIFTIAYHIDEAHANHKFVNYIPSKYDSVKRKKAKESEYIHSSFPLDINRKQHTRHPSKCEDQ